MNCCSDSSNLFIYNKANILLGKKILFCISQASITLFFDWYCSETHLITPFEQMNGYIH